MVILSIETSTKVCSAALLETEWSENDGATSKVVSSCIDRAGGNHAKQLPLFVEQLLQTAKRDGLSVDAVALSEGAGSYTGLRIGTSTAKGLCYGLNIPLIPIPTTEVLCATFKASVAGENTRVSGKGVENRSLLLPMIDARRMEVYTALYDAAIQPLTPVQAVIVGQENVSLWPSAVSRTGDVYYFGDGAAKCQEILESDSWHFVPDIVPDAACMGALAQTRMAAGKACMTTAEIAYFEPFYLKEFVAAKSQVKGLG